LFRDLPCTPLTTTNAILGSGSGCIRRKTTTANPTSTGKLPGALTVHGVCRRTPRKRQYYVFPQTEFQVLGLLPTSEMLDKMFDKTLRLRRLHDSVCQLSYDPRFNGNQRTSLSKLAVWINKTAAQTTLKLEHFIDDLAQSGYDISTALSLLDYACQIAGFTFEGSGVSK
jgi:hypothetical protein